MASPAQPPRQTSKWGSFLQQAVAGVESRLDIILAEGDDSQSKVAAADDGHSDSAKGALSPNPVPRGEKGQTRWQPHRVGRV